nr:hypothetical protein [Ferruginivarius sediminum]
MTLMLGLICVDLDFLLFFAAARLSDKCLITERWTRPVPKPLSSIPETRTGHVAAVLVTHELVGGSKNGAEKVPFRGLVNGLRGQMQFDPACTKREIVPEMILSFPGETRRRVGDNVLERPRQLFGVRHETLEATAFVVPAGCTGVHIFGYNLVAVVARVLLEPTALAWNGDISLGLCEGRNPDVQNEDALVTFAHLGSEKADD